MGTLSDENAAKLGIFTNAQGTLSDQNTENVGIQLSILSAAPTDPGRGTLADINARRLGIVPASLGGGVPPPTVALLSGLISYWKLDEASGTRADSVGTNTLGVTGTQGGGDPFSTTGKINNAVLLNPVFSEALFIASNSSLQVSATSFTFSLWVKLTSIPASGSGYWILSKSDPTTDEYNIAYLNNLAGQTGFSIWVDAGGTNYFATTGVVATTGTWYHLVGWYDVSNGQCHLRVNDTITYDSITGGTAQIGTAEFDIGRRNVAGSYFLTDGAVDEVGFWKRVLTSAEITALYNGGAGLPFSSFTP